MSDNKFILQLKGQQTPKSVVEIKNDKLVAPFVNVPNSSDAVGSIIQDKDSSVVVAKGADVWKLDGGSLVPATNLSGNGSDYTGEYAVSGNMLWVNSTYTFSDTKIFTPNTKWVLQLCGKNLNAGNGDTIDFSFIVKIGSTNIMTKTVTVSEQANFFYKRFVLDFSESIRTAIKAEKNTSLIVQLLCADATASATIYNGMTTLTALQRRVDGEAVASDLHTFEDLEVEVADIADDLADHVANKNNPHEVTKAQVGLGNCDNTSDLDKPISTATQTALNGKVNIDGTSIMTGPLKMRATSSFQCAIAPFWDGVGFYKLNSDDSVTLIASIETPDGFVPWVTNTYNIGSSLKKWKNLYLAGTAYIAKINNGYDIAVPVTNSADTLALKSEVDLAANSGRMITDQGVWYAKMYAATVAPSAENGTNYADFSQTDGQGNPIIVIYERQNGAWVQSETITPPAEYDGYVPITSKIWDITEQAGQQGGRILWNHQSKEFTPYPQIISFEDIEVTGDSTVIMPQNPSTNQIVNKDYVDNAIGNGTITITQGGETKGSFTTNQGNNTTIDIDAGGGAGHNVGDIFCTMRNDNELNGAVECNGATYNTTDFTGAQSIGQLLADGKVPYVSMAVYASTITTQGWCDKFGWDGTGNVQFKVPTLNAYIWQKLQAIIKGSVGSETSGGGGKYFVLNSATFTQFTNPGGGGYNVNVANNQTITGASADATNIVSQQRCMVQLATSASDEALETCTGVLADVAALKYDYVVDFQAPTAANNYTWYRKYKSGWVEQGGIKEAGTTTINFPVAMANTDYWYIAKGNYNNQSGSYSSSHDCVLTRNTTNMVLSTGGLSVCWEIRGVAAS